MNCFLKLSLIFVLSFSFFGANASDSSNASIDDIAALIEARDEIISYLDEVTALQNEPYGYGENDAEMRTSRDDLIEYLEELISIHDELILVQQKLSAARDNLDSKQKESTKKESKTIITSISFL